MEFPITVKNIKYAENATSYKPYQCGTMVAVRPCAKEYEDKTLLGILIGSIAISANVEFGEGELIITPCIYNPAIFIPEKNVVVFGYESWWGVIQDEQQLKQITNEDIENVWYVKALKQLNEK